MDLFVFSLLKEFLFEPLDFLGAQDLVANLLLQLGLELVVLVCRLQFPAVVKGFLEVLDASVDHRDVTNPFLFAKLDQGLPVAQVSLEVQRI